MPATTRPTQTRRARSRWAAALALPLAISSSSCGDDGSPLGPVDSIVLDREPASTPLLPTGTVVVTAAALDPNDNLIPGATVVWSSSNSGILSVTAPTTDAIGRSRVAIAANAEGTATITAKVARAEGDTVSSTISIQVSRVQVYGINTTLPPTNANCCANALYAVPVVVAENMTATHLGVVMESGGVKGRLMLYTNNAGAPGALIVATDSADLVTGENLLPLPAPRALAAGTYWVTSNYNATANFEFDFSGGPGFQHSSPVPFDADPPATFAVTGAFGGYRFAYFIRGAVP